MTSAPEKPGKPHKPKKRKWLKRFSIVLAALLLILVLFHQPILVAMLRFTVARAAAGQHLSIQYDLEGRVLSGVVLKNVRIFPTGRTPVDKISIAEVRADYGIMDLLWHGRTQFIKQVTVRNVSIVVKDLNDAESKKPHPTHLGSDLHTWFFLPVNCVGRLDATNINVTARNDDGNDFVLESGNISFERGKPGTIQIGKMHIPNLRTWENVTGQITVTEKDFTIENLAISPDVFAEKLVSTPSDKDGQPAVLSLQAKAFGGPLSLKYESTKTGDSVMAKAAITGDKIGIPGLEKFLDSAAPISGVFDHFDITLAGKPGVPSSWSGVSNATISNPIKVGPLLLDGGTAKLVLDNGAAKLDATLTSGGINKISGEAQAKMPDRLKEFPNMALDGRYRIAAPDLSNGIDGITHGNVMADGHFNLQGGVLSSGVIATASEINSDRFDIAQLDVKAEISKTLRPAAPPSPYLDDINADATVHFQGVRLDKYALDSGSLVANVKNGWLKLDAPDLRRETDALAFSGNCHISRDFSKLIESDYDVKFSVSAPNAAAFNAEPNLQGLNGQFEASGDITHHAGLYDGGISFNGTKIVSPDLSAESLHGTISIEKSEAILKDFLLVVDAKNRATATGKVELRTPFAYEGTAQARIADLSAFNPLLLAFNQTNKIGGSLTLDWQGSGVITGIHHSGTCTIGLTGGKFGNFQPITAEISGNYSPEVVQFPTLHVRVDKTDFVAKVDLHDTTLQIHDILLQQEKLRLLQGELVLPLDLRTPANRESIIPADGRVFANLTSDDINLDTLLLAPKQTSPLKGMLRVSCNADGTLGNLPANILLRIRNLQVKAAPSLAPGNLEINADLKDNVLALRGALQQPAISPLQINGTLPFSVQKVLHEGKIDDQTPVDFSVKLEKSPVAIIAQLVPSIRYIEGQMGIDAKVAGTIANPRFSGAATLDLPAIRLKDPAAPAVNGFKGNVEFTENQLLVRNFGGEISGGPFNLTGRVLFAKLTEPVLDMRLVSSNALLLRNETVTVRADSDMRIAGIFNAAHVTGNVALTKSKFFREVEILPIDLPGRPAPKPPGEIEGGFSLKPPFAKWTFDVKITTKDSFLVRGNLANGSTYIDLKLVGSGASPALDGLVRIDNFVASLPFSRLNIEYGYLYFSPENPFVPTLDIQGSSTLRDYNIHVYISGTPDEPVSVFTSDPPLPQEEIIALLGTGATSEELTNNSDVLAGRAAVLVFQNFYRRIFKHKPQETESFLSRFELDPGAVDPRTGKQEISARFKATNHVQVIGDIDAQGGLRGQIRYLLRFR